MRHKSMVWGAPAVDPLRIDAERLRQLRQLCHPDKHAGSELSRKAWDWLETVRKELDRQRV